MNQFNWTYLADNGKKHVVGIYHGAQSGHLLVYCNSKIIMIDFQVLQDSTYSFFIDDQLCELSIERREDKFYYGFNINTTADTPLNRIRKKIEKKHLLQSLGFVAGLLLLVFGTLIAINYWQSTKYDTEKEMATLLKEFGRETDAKILISSEEEEGLISYFFIVNGKGYTIRSENTIGTDLIPSDGALPIEKGDEFRVRYLPENPGLCEIDYSRPSSKQIETYKQRVHEKHLSLNTSLNERQSTCMVEIAFELKGMKGLADFYYQDIPSSENSFHNTTSFQRLVRDVPFQQARKRRCEI